MLGRTGRFIRATGLSIFGEETHMAETRATSMANAHVGARIRERRIMMGVTQQKLAKQIGVTYQQQHKYEHAINRISAGRLFEIARALNVPIGFFYDGLGDDGTPWVTNRERKVLEIARNFADITDEQHLNAINNLTRALASDD
jgi:transcriptional regulator with XRE-family HTH domain